MQYEYECPTCGTFELFFKTLPAEFLQRSAKCPACAETSERIVSPFFVNGTQKSGIEKAGAFAMNKADIGGRARPVYTDNDGRTHEVTTSRDVDRWMKNNQLGSPKMTSWKNPVTGQSSMVPQRSVMKADPISGEPLDLGHVMRESERLIPLDPVIPYLPEVSKNGRPMKNGVLADKTETLKSRMLDPETGKPFTMADLWGEGPKGTPENSAITKFFGKKP